MKSPVGKRGKKNYEINQFEESKRSFMCGNGDAKMLTRVLMREKEIFWKLTILLSAIKDLQSDTAQGRRATLVQTG